VIERVTLSQLCPYSVALTKIYEIIGCNAVTQKSDLSYQLSLSAQKSNPISLRKQEDWDGLLDDMGELKQKKKLNVSVKVVVPEHVSCFAFTVAFVFNSCHSI
jgi:hypothetical protein